MRGTENIQAFEAYLEGERNFSVVDEKKMAIAREKFEEATKLDPDFARAWGYLSYSYARSVLVGWLDQKELAAAKDYAEKAVQLSMMNGTSTDYAPYWDLAFVYLSQGDIPGAVAQYDIAVERYNNFTDRLDRKPGVLAEAAVADIQAGNRPKAIAMLKKAQLVPGWYRWNLGFAYYMEKDYGMALSQLLHPDLDPQSPQFIPEILLFRAAAQAQSGDIDGANDSIAMFKARKPNFTLADAVARWPFTDDKDAAHWRDGLVKAGLS